MSTNPADSTHPGDTVTEETLSNLLKEDRRFEPPADLAENANLKEEAYERAGGGPRGRSGPSRPSG